MKLQPIYDRILVLPIPDGSLSKGGLLIPSVAKASSPFQYGDVIAVGTGRVNLEGKLVPLTVSVGQVVMYIRKAGAVVPVTDDAGDDIPHVLIREPDIMAIVHDLPRQSLITGVDGRLLQMIPTSKGLPDSVYENRNGIEVAEREGWVAPGEHPPDEFEPGDGPVVLP